MRMGEWACRWVSSALRRADLVRLPRWGGPPAEVIATEVEVAVVRQLFHMGDVREAGVDASLHVAVASMRQPRSPGASP